MAAELRIIVLEGDETGQELLEQALRVLDPEVIGVEVELERFDLSLENRRATDNAVVTEAAAAMREARFGLKAATVTPEGKDDVGSPNRILREEIDGKVIIRTGRRIPGVTPVAGVHYPIAVVRMAVGDAYGAEQWRDERGRRRDRLPHRAHQPQRVHRRGRVQLPHGRRASTGASTAGRSGPSARCTRGCSRRRWTPRPSATRRCPTSPC